ncbi:MAG: hypothetical protein Q9167_007108 [Letrouitia subvulpina]
MSLNVKNSLVYAFPDTPVVSAASLVDRSMTALAQAVDTETIISSPADLDLPLHLKERLLSYIAAYRPQGLTPLKLQALLADPDQSRDSMNRFPSKTRFLDLSRSIGSRISFGDLSQKFTFPFLTHLCLAHPGPEISWPSFIAFAEKVLSLTHLSLAYWPMPKGSIDKRDDLHTASQYLRRLSEALIRLKYLDVEGCNDWRFVLSFGLDVGIDWSGSWKLVNSLNLSQGPMPVEVSLEGGPEAVKWIHGEVLAKQIEAYINVVRQEHRESDAPPIHVEHGWSSENCMIKYMVDTTYERLYPKGPSVMAVPNVRDVLVTRSAKTNSPNS